MNKTCHLYILMLCAVFLLLPITTLADDKENAAQEQADQVVAEVTSQEKRLLATWLHLLDSGEDTADIESSVLTYAPKVPADLARILQSTAGEGKSVSFMAVLWRTILAIGLAYLAVRALLAIFRKRLGPARPGCTI